MMLIEWNVWMHHLCLSQWIYRVSHCDPYPLISQSVTQLSVVIDGGQGSSRLNAPLYQFGWMCRGWWRCQSKGEVGKGTLIDRAAVRAIDLCQLIAVSVTGSACVCCCLPKVRLLVNDLSVGVQLPSFVVPVIGFCAPEAHSLGLMGHNCQSVDREGKEGNRLYIGQCHEQGTAIRYHWNAIISPASGFTGTGACVRWMRWT